MLCCSKIALVIVCCKIRKFQKQNYGRIWSLLNGLSIITIADERWANLRGGGKHVVNSVTRYGDFLDFGQFLKPLATINLPKSPTVLGNFCVCTKSFNFSSEIILGIFYGDFSLVTLVVTLTVLVQPNLTKSVLTFSSPTCWCPNANVQTENPREDNKNKFNVGPWWWSIGQRARLLLWRSVFESRRRPQFCRVIVFVKKENKKRSLLTHLQNIFLQTNFPITFWANPNLTRVYKNACDKLV